MQKNVGTMERAASVALGSLALWTAWRGIARSHRPVRTGAGVLSAAAAAGMMWRGATGNCPLYEKMGIDTRDLGDKAHRQFRMVRSVVIDRPIAHVQETLIGSSLRGGDFRYNERDRAFVRQTDGQQWRLKLKSLSSGTKTRLVASIREDGGTPMFRRLATRARADILRNLASDELRQLKAAVEAREVAALNADRSMAGKALLGEADRNALGDAEVVTPQQQYPDLMSLESRT